MYTIIYKKKHTTTKYQYSTRLLPRLLLYYIHDHMYLPVTFFDRHSVRFL